MLLKDFNYTSSMQNTCGSFFKKSLLSGDWKLKMSFSSKWNLSKSPKTDDWKLTICFPDFGCQKILVLADKDWINARPRKSRKKFFLVIGEGSSACVKTKSNGQSITVSKAKSGLKLKPKPTRVCLTVGELLLYLRRRNCFRVSTETRDSPATRGCRFCYRLELFFCDLRP